MQSLINNMKGYDMQSKEALYNRTIFIALRISFFALLIVWSFKIIEPFITPVLWAVIIAIAIFPFFEKFASFIGNRNKVASIIITVSALAILIVPSIIFMDSAIAELQNYSALMKSGSLKVPPPSSAVSEWPLIGKPLYDIWLLASNNLQAAITKFEPQLREFAPKVFSAAAGLGITLLQFIISIIIAGVILTKSRASEKAAKSIFTTLIGNQGENFVKLSVVTIRSVVQGVLGVAAIQSLLGGIGIWAIGIPAVGLWALIILFLAILQLPPLLILGPLAIYGFSIADTTPAVIFLIWSIIISVSDSFLKPMLLGRGVDVPMLVILLGAIGGMMLSGLLGLFIGAVVLALSYKILGAVLVDNAFIEDENKLLNKNNL
jgi:predicted PurR-regulated permease PerM